MILVSAFPVASMAASLVGRSLVVALATSPQLPAADPGAPTPKEQALIERACPAAQTAAAYEAHERCLGARLLSLRADFGRDLSRLSISERKKLDAACSPMNASGGREAYVDCLIVQLASLSAGRVRATVPAPDGTTLPAPAATPSSAASSTSVQQESSLLSVQSAAAALVAIGVVTALVFLGVKGKRARHVCRVCGVRLPGSGDLCPGCRHDAAETARRAAAERAEGQREHEAEQRRQREHVEEQSHERLRQEEERLRRLEEGRRLEEEARKEDARRQAEDLQRTRAAAAGDAADSVFDPYRALGLAPDASGDEVRAAYDEARLKYDPDQVAHLGDDAQAHFAAKSRAVERAYRMLAGTIDESVNRVIG